MAGEYLRCPYCSKNDLERKKRSPRSLGKFRIKLLNGSNSLMFQCQKCFGLFRTRFIGKILLWDDLSIKEKRTFNRKPWRESYGRNKKIQKVTKR